ncbi:hypothetical protein [Streptomyces sp. TRM75561]|uniref:hypothetical protein n=1 Tax=Streptomyces sp. TRM75561 TaxID=2975269 RepID=UPI00244C5CE2|nr:hypothetical protein [Streptomyces sp. TRM75561]MDH3038674.1 hypothetical protein [Streptomyces sp. TRM75561]
MRELLAQPGRGGLWGKAQQVNALVDAEGVVRAEEPLHQARSVRSLQPGGEVRVGGQLLFAPPADEQKVVRTRLGVLGREVMEVLLEGAGHPPVAEAGVGGAGVVQQLACGEQLGQQPVELAEVGEDHVPAQVPGEAGRVDRGRAESAGGLQQVQAGWPSRFSSSAQARPQGSAPRMTTLSDGNECAEQGIEPSFGRR